MIVACGSVQAAFSKFLGSVTGFLEKLVTSISNGTFSRTSFIPWAGTSLFVALSVFLLSMVMIPLQEAVTITGDPFLLGSVAVCRLEASNFRSSQIGHLMQQYD